MSGWNTIDSDAGVFTELVERLGVKDVQVDELYSIDAASLQALAPVHAVILLFKYGQVDRDYALRGAPLGGTYDENYLDNGIFFAQQTIQNACATQAVLNSLLNKREIDVGDELDNMRLFVAGFDAEMCGETISNSDTIRRVHNSFSAPKFIESDNVPPPDRDDKNDGLFHFVTYLNINNCIYELDGLKRFPIRHVELASPDDFYTQLPGVIEQRILLYAGEIRFSLLAITNNKLAHYQQAGDEFAVQQELAKRDTWTRENELRRHDFPKLTIELLRNISQSMSDQEWEALLAGAKAKTIQRYKASEK